MSTPNSEARDNIAIFGAVISWILAYAWLSFWGWNFLPDPRNHWWGLPAIFRLDGESSGADKEVALAKSKDIPVYVCKGDFDIYDFMAWEAPYGSP